MERRSGFTNNPKHVAIIVFAQSGFSNKCCPLAESQVLVVILVLQDRGGCSLLGWVLFLILDGTCCFILSSNFWVVRPTKRESHWHENPIQQNFFVWQERSPFEWPEGPFSHYKQHVG